VERIAVSEESRGKKGTFDIGPSDH
jgi:hypothetical protein